MNEIYIKPFEGFFWAVSKDRSKRNRQTQDVVVNFIKTVLLSTVIKIVWSYSVLILSFVSWLEYGQLIKSIFHFHLFTARTVLLYFLSLTVDICLFKSDLSELLCEIRSLITATLTQHMSL